MKNISELLGRIDVRENTIFRGHADSDWKLIPSIGRHVDIYDNWDDYIKSEKDSVDEFKRHTVQLLKYHPKSDIEWLCLMQHHGLATRLLDFTTNPLVAIFFATAFVDNGEQADGELIIAHDFDVFDGGFKDSVFENEKNFVYHPPHLIDRIIGQSGCFICTSTPNKEVNSNVFTIPIPHDRKYALRAELKQLGINNSVLFPGIDGICKDLNQKLQEDQFKAMFF